MAVTIEASSTTRRSGVVTLAKGGAPATPGDAYPIDGAVITNTSGRLVVWGLGSGGAQIYGGTFHWVKGIAGTGPLGTEEGVFPDGTIGGAANLRNTAALNALTSFNKDTSGYLNIYVSGNQVYIQNGGDNGDEDITVCYDVTIITH